jgi:hypothetical protein
MLLGCTVYVPQERYYKEKLEMPDASAASTSAVVEHYIRGLHWVLQYYYRSALVPAVAEKAVECRPVQGSSGQLRSMPSIYRKYNT